MRTILLFSFFLLALSCAGVKRSVNTQHLTLKPVGRNAIEKDSYIKDKIQLSVTIDTVQKKTKNGLQFIITLTNLITTDIEIENPIDLISISLVNDKNVDVLYPYISRKLISNDVRIKNNSFDLKEVRIGKTEFQVNEFLKQKQIILPASSSCEISLQIKKMLKADATKPYNPDNLISLQEGFYRLFFSMGIISGKYNATYSLPQVAVRYGT